METNEKMLIIDSYYKRALKEINNNNITEAKKIIHSEMPVELYDLSLSLLFNRNLKRLNEKLIYLIEKVDGVLNADLEQLEKPEDNNNDNFLLNSY